MRSTGGPEVANICANDCYSPVMSSPIPHCHHSIRLARQSGHHAFAVANERGEFIPFSTAFLWRCRLSSESHRQNLACVSALAEDWVRACDGFACIMAGTPATDGQVELLREHLRSVAPRTERKGEAAVGRDPGYVPPSVVSSNVWHQRLLQAATYIERRASACAADLEAGEARLARAAATDTATAIVAILPRIQDRAREGMTVEMEDRFREVALPSAPDNPLSSGQRQNFFVISSTELDTGMRGCEPLLLKLEDISPRGSKPTVTFVDRRDDPDDPRSRRPMLKRGPRTIGIDPALHDLLHDYVDGERKRLLQQALNSANPKWAAEARRNTFAFVSSHGSPLSISCWQKMMQRVRSAPGIDPGLQAAQFRNTYSDRWFEEFGTTKLEQLAHLLGRAPNSKQFERYAHKSIERAATQAVADRQKKYFGRKNP